VIVGAKRTPEERAIDLHIGKRLRRRRRLLGLTQPQLAESLGIRFQQIQKYECGANRIAASRIYAFAMVLNVPISYFYQGIELGQAPPSSLPETEMTGERIAMGMANDFLKIPPSQRNALRTLIEALVSETKTPSVV